MSQEGNYHTEEVKGTINEMKTILVDDELLSMKQFEQECGNIQDIELVGKFDCALEALEYAKQNPVDFALMDIEMPAMSGLELGAELKKLNGDMIIIYVTGHTRYVVDAMKQKADYCVMKPYDKQDIKDAISRAKLLSRRFNKRMYIETFGRFEIFLDGHPIYFGNSKARELFALCVHREGARVSMEQVIDVLWPERPYDEKVKRLYRKAVGAITEVLEQHNMPDVFVNKRGICYIERSKVECDLFDFLTTNTLSEAQKRKLAEGYMIDYPWAESRMAQFTETYPEIFDYMEE